MALLHRAASSTERELIPPFLTPPPALFKEQATQDREVTWSFTAASRCTSHHHPPTLGRGGDLDAEGEGQRGDVDFSERLPPTGVGDAEPGRHELPSAGPLPVSLVREHVCHFKVRANRLVARVNHHERSRRVAGWARRAESGGLETAEGFRVALSGLHCMRWALSVDFHPPHLRIRVAKRQG